MTAAAHTAVVIGLAVSAAGAFSLSTALRYSSAQRQFTAGAVRSSLARSVRDRLWLAAGVSDAAGFLLQAGALRIGALAVVQPVLSLGLVFSLALQCAFTRRRPRSSDLLHAGLVCAGLLTFLFLTRSTSSAQAAADRPAVLFCAVAGVLTVAAAVTLGQRFGDRRTPVLIGVAVGLVYAATAALTKTLTWGMSTHAPVIQLALEAGALVGVGAGGLALAQWAFGAGSLEHSLPVISVVDPLAGVVIGIAVFDEHVSAGPQHGLWLLVTVACTAFGVARLGRRAGDDARPVRATVDAAG